MPTSKRERESAQAPAEQVVETPTPEETKPVKRTQSEQLRLYKTRYERYQAPNGSLSMDSGDEVALILRGMSPEAVMRAAEKVKGLTKGALATRYETLNPGSRRMNAGNQIRGAIKRGEKTTAEIKELIAEANKELNAVA